VTPSDETPREVGAARGSRARIHAHTPTPDVEQEPTLAEAVTKEMIDEYEADRPRREAEAKALFAPRKEKP
jgi:hypothetical protein